MADWKQLPKSDLSSGTEVVLVTPSDTVDLRADGRPCRGIAFKTAGDLEINDLQGNTVIIPSGVLAAGMIHPIYATRILDGSTTATDIVAFF
jgi:hypothetical protein